MAKQFFKAGSVLLSERPLVRSDVKSLARGMAEQRERFELLRGEENLAAKEAGKEKRGEKREKSSKKKSSKKVSKSLKELLEKRREMKSSSQVAPEDAAEPFMLEAETNSFIFQGRSSAGGSRMAGKLVAFNLFSMLNHACAGSLEENVCVSPSDFILSSDQLSLNMSLLLSFHLLI